jgi:hypothetical protein
VDTLKYQKLKDKIIVLAYILFFVLCSCTSEENSSVKREYYPNGKLKSEITYVDDTTKEGKAIFYYESGKVAKESFYKRNMLDSLKKEYNTEGTLIFKGYYYKGEQIGSNYFYYDNGQLELYNALDYEHEPFYVLKFDPSGNLIKEEGLTVSMTPASPTLKEKYHIGDTMELWFCIAEPPGYQEPKVVIGMQEKSTGFVDTFKEYKVRNSKAIYSTVFKKEGLYQIICISEITNRENSLTKIDTARSFAITVHSR